MSLFDEDEMDCECCGHVGLIFNGDFDVEYPVCGAEYSLIIDEAHHIKNPNTYAYQAEQMFYDNAESIVLLTATPIQLGDRDLYVLLNLIHSDLVFDYDSFKHMSEPNPFINVPYTFASLDEKPSFSKNSKLFIVVIPHTTIVL